MEKDLDQPSHFIETGKLRIEIWNTHSPHEGRPGLYLLWKKQYKFFLDKILLITHMFSVSKGKELPLHLRLR